MAFLCTLNVNGALAIGCLGLELDFRPRQVASEWRSSDQCYWGTAFYKVCGETKIGPVARTGDLCTTTPLGSLGTFQGTPTYLVPEHDQHHDVLNNL